MNNLFKKRDKTLILLGQPRPTRALHLTTPPQLQASPTHSPFVSQPPLRSSARALAAAPNVKVSNMRRCILGLV